MPSQKAPAADEEQAEHIADLYLEMTPTFDAFHKYFEETFRSHTRRVPKQPWIRTVLEARIRKRLSRSVVLLDLIEGRDGMYP